MKPRAASVPEYLRSLPPDRREAIEAVRAAIGANVGPGFEEGMAYGQIGWHVPHRVFPAGYHCDPRMPLPYASLASQKNHMSVSLMSVYYMPELASWFRSAWTRSGKKLDMGKACIRFKKLDDVPLEVIAEAIRRVPAAKYIARYESTLAKMGKGPGARKSAKAGATKRPAGKVAKKTAKKTTKAAAKKTAKKATKKKTTAKKAAKKTQGSAAKKSASRKSRAPGAKKSASSPRR